MRGNPDPKAHTWSVLTDQWILAFAHDTTHRPYKANKKEVRVWMAQFHFKGVTR